MHVAWEYPPLVYGGLGRHVHALATAQAALGHDVVVITQHVEGTADDAMYEGVRVVRSARAPDVAFVPDNLLRWVGDLDEALAASAHATVGTFAPDVVHCHDWMTTRAGLAAVDGSQRPLLATIHATEQGRHQGYLPGDVSLTVDAIERFLCHSVDTVIVCSNAMRDEVVSQFTIAPERVHVLPNGIDTTLWQTTAEAQDAARTRWSSHGPLLVFTGRLEVEKGIFTLLDAMVQVSQARPDVRLVIAGNGTQAEQVERVRHECGLTHHVIKAGWLPESDLKALIAAADVALVPSLYEPFGLVALEAMSLGTPVVAARTGGLADIVVDDETGTTFTPGDPHDLAQALLRVLEHREQAQAHAKNARAALGNYDWARIAHDTVSVYAATARVGVS